MLLGINVGYWGLGLTSADQLEIVREAERLGYDSVWAAEAYGSDAATILAWLAAQTTKIRIGSAIFQMPGRSAAMTAMTAATLDQLSDGRMLLGIGSSGPQVAEGWHGQRFARQLARTRDYVAVVRMALARERVQYEGETLTLPLPDGPGKALKLTIAPVQERIPILLAAIGPKNTALAGEIADGWLPMLLSPEHLPEQRRILEEGAAKAGRSLDGFRITPNVQVLVSDDLAAARDAMRPIVGLYVGGMGSRDKNFYNQLMQRYGFEAAAKEIQDLYLDGKKEEACAAIPGELIDAVTLCGPEDVVRARLRVYREAGVHTLNLSPMAFDKAERIEQLRTVRRSGTRLPLHVARPRAPRPRPRRRPAHRREVAGARRGRGLRVPRRPRVHAGHDQRRPAEAVRGGGGGDRPGVRGRRGVRAGHRRGGHPHALPCAGRRARRPARRDARPPRLSGHPRELAAVLTRRAPSQDGRRPPHVAGVPPVARRRPGPRDA
jgi:F420-dependent oxidoreductase-like protein